MSLFEKIFKSDDQIIISGPCSAETEEQVLEIAKQLKESGRVQLFRSGIWKPRTKPGMFEGVGTVGLSWLKRVRSEIKLPVTIEVANAFHVQQALEYEIDVLWIGARSTSNPFSVQEIADALKGVDVPVMIKNPSSPDLDLWIGAYERIQKSGIKNIAFIHRGFASYGNSLYRNPPTWPLAVEMKRRFPEIPMICDPSHICGNRQFLRAVAQHSIDLDYHGLMLETHIQPDQAWSDAQQQITPDDFVLMLDALKWRKSSLSDHEQQKGLSSLRTLIDQTDDQIIQLLSERMKLADKIGDYKRDHQMTILQTERYGKILDRVIAKAAELGLSEAFIRNYFETVHWESINHQAKVMNEEN